MSEELQKCVLVTGGNGGLGLAIGRFFLEKDPVCHVYLGVRENRDHAENLKNEFTERCSIVTLDVTSEKEWAKALEDVKLDGRTVNVLVNNAGHHEDHLLATMPSDAWRRVIQSNLDSVYLGSQAVIRGMMEQRFGRIINIASLSALLAPVGQTNYAAAKAGVVALGQSLAKELGRMKITVNTVSPGYIETGALADVDPNLKRTIPMRRFGKPEEVASAIFFLAGQEASYITGSNLKIDGGIF